MITLIKAIGKYSWDNDNYHIYTHFFICLWLCNVEIEGTIMFAVKDDKWTVGLVTDALLHDP